MVRFISKLATNKGPKSCPLSLRKIFPRNEFERSKTNLAKIGWLSLMMEKIKQELEKGRAVVLPTETVYGLFAKALDKKGC